MKFLVKDDWQCYMSTESCLYDSEIFDKILLIMVVEMIYLFMYLFLLFLDGGNSKD